MTIDTRMDETLAAAMAAHRQGNIHEAEQGYIQVLRQTPANLDALHLLAQVWQAQSKLAEAKDLLQRLIGATNGFAQLHTSLGRCQAAMAQYDEAERSFRTALDIDPTQVHALRGLGWIHVQRAEWVEAEQLLRAALAILESPDTHHDLGTVLLARGEDPGEACLHFRRATEMQPDSRISLTCLLHTKAGNADWRDIDTLRGQVLDHAEKGRTILPFLLNTQTDDPAQQRDNAERWWRDRLKTLAPPFPRTGTALDPEKNVLVLGYLSGDFYQHATAMLMAELFELHDRSRFTVIGYSYGPDDCSPIRQRLVQAFDHFHDVRTMDDDSVCQLMQEDGIDLLIDLKGFTTQARFSLLARRPAPAMIHYLGYPGSLGGAVDFLIADPFIVPPGQERNYTETVVHMDDCYQINDGHREVGTPLPRAEYGLPEQGFVFCCFNRTYKITPALFSAWMRLLDQVPGSVLWLLCAHPQAAANLRLHAAEAGIDPERLIFAPLVEQTAHLARYQVADLFLDTFPVTAHTTASDALWAGCPVITCTGQSFMSRVAGSILNSLALPELITGSLDEYEQRALDLARDQTALEAIRVRIDAARSQAHVFNARHTTEELERCYRRIWEQVAGAGRQPME